MAYKYITFSAIIFFNFIAYFGEYGSSGSIGGVFLIVGLIVTAVIFVPFYLFCWSIISNFQKLRFKFLVALIISAIAAALMLLAAQKGVTGVFDTSLRVAIVTFLSLSFIIISVKFDEWNDYIAK